MFYYGGKTPKPMGEWRPEVHDSDGLLIHNGESGEWLWRPLQNPETLAMDYFQTQDVAGFGLLQRDQSFQNYMDPEARYEARPSAWVEPHDPWGPGQVVLIQIPTPDETNDNVVAFWRPEQAASPQDAPMTFNYSVHYGNAGIPDEPMARVVDTFVGDGSRIGGGDQEGAARVIVDFQGGPLKELAPDASVTGAITMLDGGEVLGHYVEYVPMLDRWRLSILARPTSGEPLAIRAFLKQDTNTLSETWSFKLPGDSAVINGAN
ncbi:MAG: glucan biosynthesis protein, partial [Pseudomonadota bacterium]